MIKVFLLFFLLLASRCSEAQDFGVGYQYVHGKGYVNDGFGRTHHANYLQSIFTITIDYDNAFINLSSRSGIFYKKGNILLGVHKVKEEFVTNNARLSVSSYSPTLGLHFKIYNVLIQLRQSVPVESEYNTAFLKLGERHFLISYSFK